MFSACEIVFDIRRRACIRHLKRSNFLNIHRHALPVMHACHTVWCKVRVLNIIIFTPCPESHHRSSPRLIACIGIVGPAPAPPIYICISLCQYVSQLFSSFSQGSFPGSALCWASQKKWTRYDSRLSYSTCWCQLGSFDNSQGTSTVPNSFGI